VTQAFEWADLVFVGTLAVTMLAIVSVLAFRTGGPARG
jgi:hypothetical protein